MQCFPVRKGNRPIQKTFTLGMAVTDDHTLHDMPPIISWFWDFS